MAVKVAMKTLNVHSYLIKASITFIARYLQPSNFVDTEEHVE